MQRRGQLAPANLRQREVGDNDIRHVTGGDGKRMDAVARFERAMSVVPDGIGALCEVCCEVRGHEHESGPDGRRHWPRHKTTIPDALPDESQPLIAVTSRPSTA